MHGWTGANSSGGAGGPVDDARSARLKALAGGIEQCGNESAQIQANLHGVQLLDWQSPAGRAYRDSIGRQCDALRLAGLALEEARGAVVRHAEAVAEQEAKGGGVPWWI